MTTELLYNYVYIDGRISSPTLHGPSVHEWQEPACDYSSRISVSFFGGRDPRDSKSGDVILSEVPNLDKVFAALDAAKLLYDFMSDADRDPRPPENRPSSIGATDL